MGIYQIDGDRLKICLTMPLLAAMKNNQRPKDFPMERSSAAAVLVLEAVPTFRR